MTSGEANPEYLQTGHGRRIAFRRSAGQGPGIVFLGGFRSDMSGTKALHLEDWARRSGRAFLRFDYSGHGMSSEAFEDGCIGDWAEDALAVLSELTAGPQIAVGSSMGGWIALLLARQAPDRIAGVVGIAAAPDFTEDSIRACLSASERIELESRGRIERPSEYSDEPEVITRRLMEDGKRNLVLRSPLVLDMPVRLLHGTEDSDVDMSVPIRLLSHARSPDMQLTLVKGADHRFSQPENLAMIEAAIQAVAESSLP